MKTLLVTLAAAALLALAGCHSCACRCRPCDCARDCPCDHCPEENK